MTFKEICEMCGGPGRKNIAVTASVSTSSHVVVSMMLRHAGRIYIAVEPGDTPHTITWRIEDEVRAIEAHMTRMRRRALRHAPRGRGR